VTISNFVAFMVMMSVLSFLVLCKNFFTNNIIVRNSMNAVIFQYGLLPVCNLCKLNLCFAACDNLV